MLKKGIKKYRGVCESAWPRDSVPDYVVVFRPSLGSYTYSEPVFNFSDTTVSGDLLLQAETNSFHFEQRAGTKLVIVAAVYVRDRVGRDGRLVYAVQRESAGGGSGFIHPSKDTLEVALKWIAETEHVQDWAKQLRSKPTDSGGGNGPNHSRDTPNGAQKLEETLAWMSDFDGRYQSITGISTTIDSFEHDKGCDVKIIHRTKNPPTSGTVDTFTLRDIDPAQISVSASSDSSDVNLFTLSNAPLIQRVGALSGSWSKLYMDYLSFDSKEHAERFATALKHAVTLCGGAKDPI
jgi:hypothetical protein